MSHKLNTIHGYFIKFCKVPAYVFRLIQTRGLRKAVSHLCSELYSVREFVVTKHDMNSTVELPPASIQITIAELTKNQIGDIEDICSVWPSEFGRWKPEHLKASLIHDLENDNWCFFARHKGYVIGAVWVFIKDKILESCPIHHITGERIVGRVFIKPDARGMGLSKLLYNHAVKIAIERKVPQLFGLTFPRRVASLKSKLSVGFKKIGLITVKTCLGKETYNFLPYTNQKVTASTKE